MPGLLSSIFNPKVGLILGSGGAKGMAHISIIEYIESMDIPIDFIAGSSIGALIGALYSEGKLGNFKKDILAIPPSRYPEFFEPIIPASGLLSADKIMSFIENYLPADRDLQSLKIPLAIVATDYSTGQPVVFRQGNVLQAVRASISIPGIFKPVRFKESVLIDGGVSNPLPTDVALDMGADLTIAVNLHPSVKQRTVKTESGAEKKKKEKRRIEFFIEKARAIAKMRTDNWLNLLVKSLGMLGGGDNLPNIFEIISQSIDIMGYMNSKLILQNYPPTVLIEPDLVYFNSLNFDLADEALEEGTASCERERDNLLIRIKSKTKRRS